MQTTNADSGEQKSDVEAVLVAALLTVLDQIDYTAGACAPTEMVAAVLPREAISLARSAIKQSRGA